MQNQKYTSFQVYRNSLSTLQSLKSFEYARGATRSNTGTLIYGESNKKILVEQYLHYSQPAERKDALRNQEAEAE